MIQGFKQFLMRGNVVELAVALIMGAAFGAVITSLVTDIFTPLIAAVVGKPDFSLLGVTVNGTTIYYGKFLNALITFFMVAIAVYFAIVAPVNAVVARSRRGEKPPDPTTKNCPECLSAIPIGAKRCSQCTSLLGTATPA